MNWRRRIHPHPIRRASAILLAWILVSVAGAMVSALPAVAQPQASAGDVRAIGDFTDGYGFQRRYFVVPAGLEARKLIGIAETLHRESPQAYLWLLDSDEKAAQMMAAMPAALKGETDGYPADWVAEHTAAHLELQLVPKGGRRWALIKGPLTSGEVLNVWPCDSGPACGKRR